MNHYEQENFDQIRLRLLNEAKSFKDLKDISQRFINDFDNLIQLTIFSLMHDPHERFFAQMVVMIRRNIDCTFHAPAAVSLSTSYFDLHLNPLIFLNYKIKEMKAILVHELYHIIYLHLQRMEMIRHKYKKIIINIGLDVAINQFIRNLPEGICDLQYLKKEFNIDAKPKETAEYYIELLHQESKTNEKLQGLIKNSELQRGQIDIDSLAKEIMKGIMHDKWDESDKTQEYENLKDVVRRLVNDAAEKSTGNIPNDIQELISKLNEKPQISWQEILKVHLGSIPVPYKKTIMRRDRRQHDRLDLRGRLSDHIAEIIVAIDTSGSMGEKELQYIFNEIFAILKNKKFKLTIIECDAIIQKIYQVKNRGDVDMTVMGRGGTSFDPVFEYIREKKLRKTILLYFTDGLGDFELKNRPINFRTIWILTGKNSKLSLKEPYGQIKNLILK